MKIITENGISAAVVEKDVKINGVGEILDILVSASYDNGCDRLIVYKESLGEKFFDLKTGYAGEILQKFSNYKMKIAIIGDFNEYVSKSKSFHDFIYESNKGNHVFFKATLDEGMKALAAVR